MTMEMTESRGVYIAERGHYLAAAAAAETDRSSQDKKTVRQAEIGGDTDENPLQLTAGGQLLSSTGCGQRQT